MITNERRIVFFDLDGTLHQQDLFGNFLFYLLRRRPLNLLLVLFLLPIIIFALLFKGFSARYPMSLLLWGCTFGYSEVQFKHLEEDFICWFRNRIITFPTIQRCLTNHLLMSNTDIWLITGSPQSLVKRIYSDAPWISQVNLIGTQIGRAYGGWVLTMRCLGYEKVAQLEKRIGAPLRLYSGYSDSKRDNPMFFFCQQCWRVTSAGKLQQLK